MWLINGPFDNAQTGDEDNLKTKLLKTNSIYGLGRHQDSKLCINSKKISRQNGEFIIGEHSEDDVSNSALVPTLSLRNNKTVALKISRSQGSILVNPDSTQDLESGDIVNLTGSISVIVTWEPVVCFHAQDFTVNAVDFGLCASLGIKVVTKHSRDVTHHLTPGLTIPLTPTVLFSLLTPARFVTPEWFGELIRLGTDDDRGLEKTYNQPIESGFRPEIDSAFSERYPTMAKKATWSPNDGRKSLFEGMRFVFLVMGSGAGTESKAMADVVLRGGAARQLLDIEKEASGHTKAPLATWVTELKKRDRFPKKGLRSGLILVGEEEIVISNGIPKEVKHSWEAMVDRANSVNMHIIHPSLIAEAIFKADVSLLDCTLDESVSKSQDTPKSFPDHIPSTHPEEPSQLEPAATQSRQASAEPSQPSGSGVSRRLVRRATSRTPAPEPAPAIPMEVEEEPSSLPPPRRLLKRRAKTAGGIVNELLGIDESAGTLGTSRAEPQSPSHAQVEEDAPPVSLQEVVSPIPARPGRLKRRAGTVAIASQLFPDLSVAHEDGEEPPLKKFKDLFEQSGHGEIAQHEDIPASQLQVIREDDELPSQSQNQTQKQRRKQTADIMGSAVGADAEMESAEESAAPKRHAIEALQPSQQAKPPSSKKPSSVGTKPMTISKQAKSDRAKGAAPGKPDTDPTFLRAIASTKRGKKTEDEFDREFNKLRIARPDINNTKGPLADRDAPWGREWEGLDDFERDIGVRGNFMQIVEMDVWRDRQPPGQPARNIRREEGLGARVDWDGREDFKKFRRKMNVQPKALVQLVIAEPDENAAGPSYWESRGDKRPRGFDDMSQSQGNGSSQNTRMQTQDKHHRKSQPKRKGRMALSEDDEDDEVEEVIGTVPSKGRAKPSRAGEQIQALFNPASDDDLEDIGTGTGGTLHGDDEDVDLTLRADKSQEKTRGMKRKTVVPEESDSDDGMNFGGFAKKAKRLKR